MDDFMTSAEAARFLGVGPTSVKRWADAGWLECVKTAGGHRRFRREVVLRFQNGQSGSASAPAEQLDEWIRRISSDLDPHGLQSALLAERARLGSWTRTADLIGQVLVELGARWCAGSLSVLDEHLATERLTRGLVRCAEAIPLRAGAPRVLLANAPGDEHTLGLRLAELCLRERGWNVLWGGGSLPVEELERILREGGCKLLGLSAAENAHDADELAAFVRRIGSLAAECGVELVLGGAGAWPEAGADLPRFRRVRSFRELDEQLAVAIG
ncbi:MAG: helix-turn-helix domain-containing protein [Planctomycetes bacterium]|nr:helix-turn-helix domain-containing protein [Planctomycetota bacterium]